MKSPPQVVATKDLSSPASASNREISPGDSIDARAAAVEGAIRELEDLAQSFKLKAERVATVFEALRGDLNEYALEYNGLMMDHTMALEALDEEKLTADRYHGALRNAEVEIKILQSLVPDDQLDYQVGFSQARPW